ncbi:GntR family transcriptional regulator [Candidatus Saccharibacteria bacterium]|nr:GntR family transcriptional regulator [Candidatus Saccharibacteria bacterium]
MQVTQSQSAALHFNFSSGEPIYLQLAEKLELLIVSGTYLPGDKLPSVRELALEAKINPNTVQKSLSLLESNGLISTERTNGKFVTQDRDLIAARKLALAKKYTTTFLLKMAEIGFHPSEVARFLKTTGDNLKGNSSEENSF